MQTVYSRLGIVARRPCHCTPPTYDPIFVSAEEAGYEDDELVMGIEIAGQVRAYPVGLLNQREMVNDELAGIPILVTW